MKKNNSSSKDMSYTHNEAEQKLEIKSVPNVKESNITNRKTNTKQGLQKSVDMNPKEIDITNKKTNKTQDMKEAISSDKATNNKKERANTKSTLSSKRNSHIPNVVLSKSNLKNVTKKIISSKHDNKMMKLRSSINNNVTKELSHHKFDGTSKKILPKTYLKGTVSKKSNQVNPGISSRNGQGIPKFLPVKLSMNNLRKVQNINQKS